MPFGAATDVAYIEVKPSIKGWDKSVRGTIVSPVTERAGRDAGDKAGGAFRGGFSRATHAAGSLVKGVLGGAALAGGAVLGTALTKGFSRLEAIDDARAKLTGLGNTGKQTDAIMKNALASVKGTAFGMDEAATTAAGAVAAGVKPGKDLQRTLSLTADAATIAGTSMGDMGSIFNKVATSNKIQGDTIAQLSDKGVPVVQFLAKSLHKSSDEVVQLASKGKINFAQFQTAMQQGLGGAAQSSGKTFSGAMKNIQASLGRIGAGLLGGIFPHLAPTITQITKGMEPLEAKSKVIGDHIGVWLGKGLQKLPVIISGIKQKWAEFQSGMKDGQSFTIFQKLGNWAAIAGRHISPLVSKVKGLFSAAKGGDGGAQLGGLLDKLKNADWSSLGESLKNIGSQLGKLPALGPVVASGMSLFATVLGFAADHAGLLAKVLPVLVGAFVAYKLAQVANQTVGRQSVIGFYLQIAATTELAAAKFVEAAATRGATAVKRQELAATGEQTAATNTGILASVRQRVATVASTVASRAQAVAQRGAAIATGVLTGAQRLLTAAFIGSPIGLIVVGLIALAAGLVLAYKKSATFRAIVQGAINGVKAAAVAVTGWFTRSFVPFFTKTIPGAFQGVLNFVRSHWKLILGLITGPIGAAVILVASNWGKIRGFFSSAWSWAKGTWSKWWGGLKTILLAPVKAGQWWISHYIAAVRAVFTGAWSWATGTFRKSWAGWQALMTKPVSAARDAISNALGWGKNGLRTIFNNAVSGIGKIWSGLKKVMTTPLNNVMGLIEKFAHAVGKIPGLGSLKNIKLPRFGDGGSVANGGGHSVLPALATGGRTVVQGPWRGPKADNVLGVDANYDAVAMVNPGEWYHNVAATRSMSRHFPGYLEHINRYGRPPGFAGGGMPGSGQSWRWQWAQVHRAFPDAQLTSAYRPGARTAGDGQMSYHAIGRAIDLGGSRSMLTQIAKWIYGHYRNQTHDLLYTPLWGNNGFYKGGWFPQHGNTIAQHRNHVHWGLETAAGMLDRLKGVASASGGGGIFDWIADKAFSVPKKLFTAAMGKIPASGMAKMMISGFTGKIVDAVKNFVTGHADGGDMTGLGGSAPGNSLAAIAMGKKMAAARGWTGRQWSSLYSLWNGESGWNPRAKNASSGAFGIPQALPGSKMAAAGRDWATNGATQIKWGLGYIRSVYGTPAAAYAKWLARRPHWYGTGTNSAAPGLNVVGDRGPELVFEPSLRMFRGGERVLDASKTRDLLGGGGRGGDNYEFNYHGGNPNDANAFFRDFYFDMIRTNNGGRYADV